MVAYGYRCGWCGPFEKRANSRAPGGPAVCPSCGGLAPRAYDAPGGRSPRRTRHLDRVAPAGRARIERAETGVPVAGPRPGGRHLHGASSPPPPARPWQIGH